MTKENTKSEASPNPEGKEPGLRGLKTTNVFRIVNFELFAKPNKRVMGLGTAAFLAACGYILYIRLTDEYKGVPTYTSISDDGTLTRRVKQSKWD